MSQKTSCKLHIEDKEANEIFFYVAGSFFHHIMLPVRQQRNKPVYRTALCVVNYILQPAGLARNYTLNVAELPSRPCLTILFLNVITE